MKDFLYFVDKGFLYFVDEGFLYFVVIMVLTKSHCITFNNNFIKLLVISRNNYILISL